MWVDNVKRFWASHEKLIKIILAAVLSLAFIGSVIGAVFGGGEFSEVSEEEDVKGLMRLNYADYTSSYIAGDNFEFDKQTSEIMLVAKDPAIENIVKINKLPASEYGFCVNGEGEIIDEPSSIVMNSEITFIDIVSKKYPALKTSVDVHVIAGLDGEKLVSELTLEAEKAELYKDGVLLTEEDKKTLPNDDKPYISSEGTTKDGASCSDGACLRNFQTDNMKVEFTFVCSDTAEVNLEVLFCLRKESKTFGEYFLFKLNGEEVSGISDYLVPKGTDFYTPHSTSKVTVTLKRGINVITLESGNGVNRVNPVNLDAVKITAADKLIGDMGAVVNSEEKGE